MLGSPRRGGFSVDLAHHGLHVLGSRVFELALAVRHEGGIGGCDDDVEFEFGLDRILDGMERLRERATPSDRR